MLFFTCNDGILARRFKDETAGRGEVQSIGADPFARRAPPHTPRVNQRRRRQDGDIFRILKTTGAAVEDMR